MVSLKVCFVMLPLQLGGANFAEDPTLILVYAGEFGSCVRYLSTNIISSFIYEVDTVLSFFQMRMSKNSGPAQKRKIVHIRGIHPKYTTKKILSGGVNKNSFTAISAP